MNSTWKKKYPPPLETYFFLVLLDLNVKLALPIDKIIFFFRFLEHALKDLDYEVRDKNFLESVLGNNIIILDHQGPYTYPLHPLKHQAQFVQYALLFKF